MKRYFVMSHDTARQNAIKAVVEAPEGYAVTIQAFSQQLLWPVNGQMVKMTDEEWKDVLTAAFDGETNPKLAMGLNGGVVMLGKRTSKFGKKRFSEWLEFLHAVAADRGVQVYVE